MKTSAIAWAAGLFEGEGSFSYQGPNAARSGANVRAELSMTDYEPVKRFAEIVGVGRLVAKPKRFERHNDQLLWRVTDRAGVIHVLELLRPWLSARRLARGEEILRLQAEVTAELADQRAARCKNGHTRTAENTRMQPRKSRPPYRRCLECDRDWKRAKKSSVPHG